MLPTLLMLEFSDIIPLSENKTYTIELNEGVNAILANNGAGKTTLCDIIERSICSDAHAQRYSSFVKKRTTKDAFIKSKWFFENETLIHQLLTDGGIRTRVTERGKGVRSYSKEEYSNHIYRELRINLAEFQDLYQSLYYKREDDHTLLGREETDLYSFFTLLNKYTSGAPEDYQLRQKIRELEAKRKNLQDQIKKMEETEEKIRTVMQMLGIEEMSDQILSSRYQEIEIEKKRKEEEIKTIEAKITALEKEEEKRNEILFEKRENTYLLRAEVDKLKAKRGSIEVEKEKIRQEIKVAEKVGSEKYDEIKTKVAKKPSCEFCNSNLLNSWDKRINVGCPLCGTEWQRLPRELKEGLFKIENQEEPQTEALEEMIMIKNEEIKELSGQIEKAEEEYKKAKKEEIDLQQEITNIRAEIKSEDRKIRSIMNEINDFVKKATEIETQRDMQKTNVNLNAVIARKEGLKNKHQELQDEIAVLKAKESSTKEKEQILKQFLNTTMSIFGYGMAIEPRTMNLSLMVDGSVRAYESMSGGEKYFVDLCLRIAVWKYLLERGFVKQATMVIDSPENALDEERLIILADVLNKEKENFVYVVTTRNKEFYKKLYANPIEVKKMIQTSLFDFMKREE